MSREVKTFFKDPKPPKKPRKGVRPVSVRRLSEAEARAHVRAEVIGSRTGRAAVVMTGWVD